MSLANDIMSFVQSNYDEQVIQPFDFRCRERNQMVLFIKPECFLDEFVGNANSILKVIFQKIAERKITVSGCVGFRGSKIQQYKIIRSHYATIDYLSRFVTNTVTQNEIDLIIESLSSNTELPIIGGHEFLKKYPSFNAQSLNQLWLAGKSLRLRSGFYFQLHVIQGAPTVIVNGFLPNLINHYTNSQHHLVVLLLCADCNWRELKEDFAGNTYPERASPRSIRGYLYNHRHELEIKKISVNNNYIHLSGGAFEAAREMYNVLHNIEDADFNIQKTNLYLLLKSLGRPDFSIEKLVTKPVEEISAKDLLIFTKTELLDTDQAINRFFEMTNNKLPPRK